MNIPIFRVDITEEEIAEVADSLRSGWLTTGPKVKRFEALFAEAVGSKHAIALNSCTAALHLALEAIGIKRGDLVLVPALTFAATAEVVRYFDAIPVFVDCDDTLCMSPQALEQTLQAIHNNSPFPGITPPYNKVKAVIPMHYGGFVADMKFISEIAYSHGITIIEDSAHAFPASYRSNSDQEWVSAGRFGKVGCYSFYANKCITTGEGGMAITDDDHIAERMRLMSLHGMNKDAWKRFTSEGDWFYEIVAPGFKYNLTDTAAALGLHQLRKAELLRQRREQIAKAYNNAFRSIDALEIPPYDPDTRIHSWHLYALRLNLNQLTINRDEFIRQMQDRGVKCSVHWYPLHLNPYYRETFNTHEGMFPNAEAVWPRLVSLPIFPSMTDEEIAHVIWAVKDIVNRSSQNNFLNQIIKKEIYGTVAQRHSRTKSR